MSADDRVWHGTSAPSLLSLAEILAHLRPGCTLPHEASASRLALPDDADLRRVDDGVPDHLLPALLRPAEKRVLDCLADWPAIAVEERRALNPSTMAARLAPYLRYYSSTRPLDDHGERPLVLIAFEDPLAEANFLGVARRETERAGVRLPLWVSHGVALESAGPLGEAWRSPDVLEPVRIF